ncbi:MAG: DUF2244 domain-containing protein [Burkholderiales bacterium]|nr:DUF2244 domain-containing protein [Burkholderiales bacterium]
MPRDLPPEFRIWVLRRRGGLLRRQMLLLFAMLCVPTLLAALGFTWQGYWPILGFAGLELVVVASLLLYWLWHANDYDRIEITLDGIVIEQRRARQQRRLCLNTWHARLIPPQRDADPILLADRNHTIALGTLVGASERRQVEQEIARFLPTSSH